MHQNISQSGCPKCGSEVTAIHDKKRNRLRCRACGKTWSAHRKEFHFGLRSESIKIRRTVDLLKVKIPIRTIARFVKISPTTVVRWKKRLGIMPVR
ncbi:MAG: hypothetical protein AAB739_02725 [Patescibacteria group bacterium]